MGVGDTKGAINTSSCEARWFQARARCWKGNDLQRQRESEREESYKLSRARTFSSPVRSTWLPITLLPLTTRITNLRRHHLEQRPRWLDRYTSNIYPANRSWLHTLLRCTLYPRTMRSERSLLLDFLKMSRHGKYTISSASFPVMNPLIFVPTLAHRCFSNFIW